MKKFYLFIFVLILFFLQYSVLGVFLKLGRIPNLFVAFTVSLAILFGFEKSVGWVILAGLFMDAGSSWLLGSGTLILVAVLWIIEKIKIVAELRSKRYYFVMLFSILVFLSSFLFDVILNFEIRAENYFFQNMPGFSGPEMNFDYFFKYFYSVILGIGIYHFARKARTRSFSLPSAQKMGMK